MRTHLLQAFTFIFVLSFGCSKSVAPENVQQEKVIYALGDTSAIVTLPSDTLPLVTVPEVITRVEPQMPEYAKLNNIEGNVFVKCWITINGIVRGAIIIKSDNDIFNRPALEATLQWVFSPARKQDGTPGEICVSILYRFRTNQ